MENNFEENNVNGEVHPAAADHPPVIGEPVSEPPVTEVQRTPDAEEPSAVEAEQAPDTEEASTVEAEQVQDAATQEEAAPPEAPATIPVSLWGEPPAKHGIGFFFGIFGTVLGACVLLLLVTILTGKGCQITENIHYDRTVYVREDGTVVGTYTPGEVVDLMTPSTVTVIVKNASVSGFGSGFIYSADGYIITNHHVIAAGGDVQVMLHDNKVYDAAIVGSNAAADVAVLKIEASQPLTPVKLGNSNAVLVGESVAAIGTPVELGYQGTATFGRVSASSRIVTFSDSQGNVTKRMYVLQTDTSVNPGNSGGPLVNMDGEVIGVVVMKLMGNSQEYYEGLGFALPINGVKTIADEIIAKGSFTGVNPIAKGRLLLGIMGHSVVKDYWYKENADGTFDISMSEAEGYLQMPESGVRVVSAQSDGGAMGILKHGDIIIKADGLRVLSIDDLIDTVNRRESGYGVTLTILRDGAELDVVVNLNEEPLK